MKTHAARRFARALLATSVAAGLLVSGTSAPASAECVLAPVLRDYTLNQGLGSYSPLARGKETLVRFYLSKPQCDTSTALIEVTKATLSLDDVAVPVASVPEDASPYQPVGPWTATPIADSAADPKFVIPGELVDRPDAAFPTTFDVKFSASVQYQVRPAPGAAVTATGTATFGADPFTGTPIKATYGKRADALRLLVVPMGNASQSFSSQFPVEAVQSVQTAMQTASRLLPVPDGVGALTTTGTEGIRYAVAPKMLDVTKWMTGPGGKFCPTNSTEIGAALESELAVFNSATANRVADRVVGVIWHSISAGTEAGCYDGWANVLGRGSWARSFAAGTDDRSGAVLTHEILHTFGDVSDSRVDTVSNYHTRYTQADRTAPNRGYNIDTRRFLADDKAIMRLGPNWRDETVLLEKEDWNIAQCAMTDGFQAEACDIPGGVGGALAGPSFVITGRTDGTAAGSDLHSYYGDGAFRPEPDADSPYRLVQRASDKLTILKSEGVPLSPDSVHDAADGTSGAGHSGDLIDFATEVVENPDDQTRRAEWFQLYKGDPASTGVLLYERRRGSAPTIVSSSFTPIAADAVNFTATPTLAERGSAVSPSGDLVGWQDATGIVVSDRSARRTAPIVGATDLTFKKDGSAIAYVRGGSVYMRTVSSGASGPSIGTEQLVYSAALQSFQQSVASGPTFSPDGSEIAVSIDGDIWSLSVDFALLRPDPVVCRVTSTIDADGCRRLTTDARRESEPDWSLEGRVAYVVDGIDDGLPAKLITVLDVASGQVVDSGLRGSEPSWGAELLAFTGVGGIKVAAWRYAGELAFGVPSALTAGNDSSASLTSAGTMGAFTRASGAQSDVYVVGLERRRINFEMSDPDGLAGLRADVLLRCEGITYVLFAGLKPSSVSGGVASFTANYDPAMACDGDIVVRGTDGYNTVTTVIGQIRRKRGPVAAIATPAPGTVLLEHEALPVRGAALDPSGEVTDQSTFLWELDGPNGLHQTLGNEPQLQDQDAPANGWPVGIYTLTLTVTYGGQSSVAKSTFSIVADDDGDKLPPPRDGCNGSRDNDPTNVYGDDDFDGLLNLEDPTPCVSDNNAIADFEPNTLYVPSEGTVVTVYIRSSKVDVRTFSASGVAITQIAQWPAWIPALSWSVSRGVATVKFDKQALSSFIASRGLVGQYVPVAVTGSSTTSTLRAVDPTAPYTSPGS